MLLTDLVARASGMSFADFTRKRLFELTLRFRRDNAGKVVAFDYSNPLVRNIKFTRLSDGASHR